LTEGPFTSAIIVAAGSGRRMGMTLPKQFVELNGRPLLAWTIDNLLKVPQLAEIILVVSDDQAGSPNLQKCLPGHCAIPVKIVAGGERRQDSVYSGLKALNPQSGIVAIHDGVRPFADPALIAETIRLCAKFDGAVLAIPAVDTLKEVEARQIIRTVDRQKIWQVQTPQTFRRAVLERAYANAYENNLMATDDSRLVEMIGGRVAIVESTPNNLKITCQNDLIVAKSIMERDA
jgi:2-C-methyl-D-erythritol 4-phosphate cytidylyltransferase